MNSQLIARNASILLISDLIVRLLIFLVPITVARVLGDEVFGQYAFILAFSWIAGELTSFGIDTVITREIAKNPESRAKYLENALALQAIISIVALIIISVLLVFLPYSNTMKFLLAVATLAYFLRDYGNIFVSVFYVDGKLKYEALARIIAAVIYCSAIFSVKFGYGLIVLVLIHFARYSSRLVTSFFFYIREYKIPKLSWDTQFWKMILRESIPLWFVATFSVFQVRIDTVFIKNMLGYAPTGWYSAVFTLIDVLLFVPVSMTTVAFPILARWYHCKDDRFTKLYHKVFYYLVILSIPCVVAGLIIPGQIIGLIYGSAFEQSVPILRVMCLAAPLFFCSIMFSQLLTSIGRQRIYAWIAGLGIILNVILLLILIPLQGVIGAAMATVITLGLTTVSYYIVLRKHTQSPPLSLLIRPSIAGVLMGGTIYIMALYGPLGSIWVLVNILISSLVYVISLGVFGGISRNDYDLVRSIFFKKKILEMNKSVK